MLQKLFPPILLSIIYTWNCMLFWGACLLLLPIQVYIVCNVDGPCLMIFCCLLSYATQISEVENYVCAAKVNEKLELSPQCSWPTLELAWITKPTQVSILSGSIKSRLASACHELSSEEWTPKRYMLWRDWTSCFEDTNHFGFDCWQYCEGPT